jgi:hypothetical protein
MYASMAELRKRQRAKRKYYKALEYSNNNKIDPEDEGLISFRNHFNIVDPTPAKADRKDYS